MKQCRFRFLRCLLFAAVLVPAPLALADVEDEPSAGNSMRDLMTAIAGVEGAIELHSPSDIAIDHNGNLLVTDFKRHTVLRISPDGAITVLAGDARVDVTVIGDSRDGFRQAAEFQRPQGIVSDAWGNFYVADAANNNIRKISPVGQVPTVEKSRPSLD